MIVKVAAIISTTAFGGYPLFSDHDGPTTMVTNLWQGGGFFPSGIMGLAMAMAATVLSFGGPELVRIIAAEADEPYKTIPKATNQVIYRILLFYVGSLAALPSLYLWCNVVEGDSPLALILHAIDSNIVANAPNLVVLAAALSVYNSYVYCSSRMLFGLAQQDNAPWALLRVNHRGILLIALAVSTVTTTLCVVVNYVMFGKTFGLLMALVVAALVISWAMICITHLKLRRAVQRVGKVTAFQSLDYPLTNWLCLLSLVGTLVVMYLTPDIRISVCPVPVWLLILAAGYLLRKKNAPASATTEEG